MIRSTNVAGSLGWADSREQSANNLPCHFYSVNDFLLLLTNLKNESNMSKAQDAKKETKKEPKKTLKEKRADKKAKKAGK